MATHIVGTPAQHADLAFSAVNEARGICALIQYTLEGAPRATEAAAGACRLLEIAAEQIEALAKSLPAAVEVSHG